MNINFKNKRILPLGKMSAGQMGKTLLCLVFLFILNNSIAQKEFSSERELNNYAYSNTNLKDLTNGYLLDWEINYEVKDWEIFYNRQKDRTNTNLNHVFNMFGLLEKIDIHNKFEMDSILFPIMYNMYANDGYSAQNLPLYIFDMEVTKLQKDKSELVKKRGNENSYPQFKQEDFKLEKFYTVGAFVDTLVQNYIQLYWNDKTIISNTNRTVENVELIVKNQTIKLQKDTPYDLSSFYDETNPLKEIIIKVTFSDGEVKINTQSVYLVKTPYYAQNKNVFTNLIYETIGGDFNKNDPYSNTVLQYQTHYGCNNQILDKPYIILAGWGTFTDKKTYNSFNNVASVIDADNGGMFDVTNGVWPTPFDFLYNQFNSYGLIDSLREANYDVIVARFLPPNSDLRVNAGLIAELLNTVNAEKMANGSYEENILQGYSFGAVGANHALLSMEYDHLNNGGPHHHTKLYVSYEGEHGGANIPLGVQHSVQYLNNHIDDVNLFTNTMTIYTLHFLINNTAGRQMMRYHFSETGTWSNPGADMAQERYDFLADISSNNHSKNTHNPDYPAFCRNISVSNGQNVSDINGTTSTHTPFPTSEAEIFFERSKYNKHVTAKFSGVNSGYVFRASHKISSYWQVVQQNNPGSIMVLDNAPGGAMFIKQNPILPIMKQLKKMVGGNPQTYDRYQFCFTPTILTHAIKNYNASANGYRLHYSFKEEGLMFQNVDDIGNLALASNYYGYPHLFYPNNHYTDYTPFDAIFTWSKNTVHIKNTEVNLLPTQNGNYNYIARKNPLHFGVVSNVITHITPFLLAEADVYNSYVQNRKYGFNANSNYIYKADVYSPHSVFIGSNVTQRTDFKVVEVQQNANLHCQAADAIHIKPGFYAKNGSVFHANIQPYACTTTKSMVQNNPNKQIVPAKINKTLTTTNVPIVKKQTPQFKIYPNPSTGLVNIELQNSPNNTNFTYQIYNLSGKLVHSGQTNRGTKQLILDKGMYLVHLQQKNKSYTQKLVVY